MKVRFLPFLMLPILGMAQANSNGEVPLGGNISIERQPLEIKRNAQFNLEEIKVRWKKVALENCQGAPCLTVTPAPSFIPCPSSIDDIDLNNYTIVTIGTQCWTKENLKVSKYNDGTAIPLNNTYTSGTVSTVWAGLTTGAYAIYANEASSGTNATNYGYLYNWYAAAGIVTSGGVPTNNICPTGYHVPTDSDWNKLVKFIDSGADTSSTSGTQSTTAGDKLKKNDALWNTNTGTNDFLFSALPGGYRKFDGSFSGIRDNTFFWIATENDITFAGYRNLSIYNGNVGRFGAYKSFGASVRCLRD